MAKVFQINVFQNKPNDPPSKVFQVDAAEAVAIPTLVGQRFSLAGPRGLAG